MAIISNCQTSWEPSWPVFAFLEIHCTLTVLQILTNILPPLFSAAFLSEGPVTYPHHLQDPVRTVSKTFPVNAFFKIVNIEKDKRNGRNRRKVKSSQGQLWCLTSSSMIYKTVSKRRLAVCNYKNVAILIRSDRVMCKTIKLNQCNYWKRLWPFFFFILLLIKFSKWIYMYKLNNSC